MTRQKIESINRERLGEWIKQLTDAHATAAVLIGIGHDHASGELHVCLPKDLPANVAGAYIGKAFLQLLREEARRPM